VFDNLCLSEASTKHKEKEFCVEFSLIQTDSTEINLHRKSRPFYAYSHKRVLSRRRNIKLRTLNKNYGNFYGGETMHVVGTPFINGPSLKIIFKTPNGDVAATNLELYSESVLFFKLPPFPMSSAVKVEIPEGTEIKASVVVTNDGGKTYSNSLEFTYVVGNVRSRF